MNSQTTAIAAPETTCGVNTMPVTAPVPGSFLAKSAASRTPAMRLTPTTTTTQATETHRTMWKDGEANIEVEFVSATNSGAGELEFELVRRRERVAITGQ